MELSSTTPITKILPPARPEGSLARPALAERVTTALARRLSLVVADAGFGKSTLLTSWWEAAPCAWYSADQSDGDLATFARRLTDALRLRVPDMPAELARLGDAAAGPEPESGSRADALASRLAEALTDQLTTELLLVIDDIHELSPFEPSTRLVEGLTRHAPPRLHLVLAGRTPPAFRFERLRGRGQLLELTADQLAFTLAEVAELVEARLGGGAAALAGELHALAGGWPAAVILAIEALRESPRDRWRGVLSGIEGAGAPLFAYLAEEVFAHHPDAVRNTISRLAVLERFTPELCEAVGVTGARAILQDLSRRGLFVERGQDGTLALRPLIREYALEHLPLAASTAHSLRVGAAGWYAAHGASATALQLLLAAPDVKRLGAMLAADGSALLAGGHVSVVLAACRAIVGADRTSLIDQLEGEALQVQGDWTGALSCFERAAAGVAVLPAHLAWRMGVIHYLRGELDTALDVYRRGMEDTGAEAAEMALLLAWTATTYWLRGEVDACRPLATRSFEVATACGDRRALAAAHTVLAMLAAHDGDRRGNDAHYLLALRAAEEAGDVLQMVRIHTNRASHFIEEGAYHEGLQELEVAIRLAELSSFASFLALSLSNRGDARFRLGRLDEALADFEASRAKYEEIGSDMVAYSLVGIGQIYRERGNLVQARAAFEDAIDVAEPSGDVQGLVPALAGLATVVVVDDPDAATDLADRAVAHGTGLTYVTALLAGGWVAAYRGDRERAMGLATTAAEVARSRRDRPGLAEALALGALSAADPPRQAARLREAIAIWHEIGEPLSAAKAQLALAVVDPGPGASTARREAERELDARGLGPRTSGTVAAGVLAMVARADPRPVRIQTMGGFAVFRGGEAVRPSEWQSKRARELLKFLVARRGRPTPRAVLVDALWPDEDADSLGNRLSVALTTIRAVLVRDKTVARDEPIRADRESVALNLDAVDVDVEHFLHDATEGLRRLRAGDVASALPLLEAAEVAYAGEFLAENLYDDWAAPAREEARAAYVAVARALATDAAGRADADSAVRYFLRILETDRFDEEANLALVRALEQAGRHGESHRHYLNYRRAMADLGVEPVPFPAAFTKP